MIQKSFRSAEEILETFRAFNALSVTRFYSDILQIVVFDRVGDEYRKTWNTLLRCAVSSSIGTLITIMMRDAKISQDAINSQGNDVGRAVSTKSQAAVTVLVLDALATIMADAANGLYDAKVKIAESRSISERAQMAAARFGMEPYLSEMVSKYQSGIQEERAREISESLKAGYFQRDYVNDVYEEAKQDGTKAFIMLLRGIPEKTLKQIAESEDKVVELDKKTEKVVKNVYESITCSAIDLDNVTDFLASRVGDGQNLLAAVDPWLLRLLFFHCLIIHLRPELALYNLADLRPENFEDAVNKAKKLGKVKSRRGAKRKTREQKKSVFIDNEITTESGDNVLLGELIEGDSPQPEEVVSREEEKERAAAFAKQLRDDDLTKGERRQFDFHRWMLEQDDDDKVTLEDIAKAMGESSAAVRQISTRIRKKAREKREREKHR